jgi:transcriptional regulator with XRE-family HTH domain
MLQNPGHGRVGNAQQPRQMRLFNACECDPFLQLHSQMSITDRKKLSMKFSGYCIGLFFRFPVNSENMKKNNVQIIRLRKGMTMEKLSLVSGIPITTLHRIENGQPVEKYRKKLAAALTCDPAELDAPEFDARSVPVVGVIKFKSYVKMLPEKEWEPTEHFDGLPEKARAIRVGGSHLKPDFSINTVLYYDASKAAPEKLFLERQCLVQLPPSKRTPDYVLWWVSRGSKPGVYTLTPYAGDTLYDQPILKAYRIIHSRQG